MERKVAVISGITGKYGSSLAKLLLDKDYRVIGLYRRNSSEAFEELKDLGLYDRIEFMEFDLLEISNIAKLFNRIKPDEFYNLETNVTEEMSFENPVYTTVENGQTVINLLEMIREFSPETKLFQASSYKMLGDAKNDYKGDCLVCAPKSPYGTSKLFGHWIITNYNESFNTYACSGVLYESENPYCLSNPVLKETLEYLIKYSNGQTDSLLEVPNNTMDLSYAGDFALGMWQMLQQQKPDWYLLASGKNHTVQDFVNECSKYLGISLEWTLQQDWILGTDAKTGKTIIKLHNAHPQNAGDIEKTKSILGWETKVSFEELCRMIVEVQAKRYSKTPAHV